VFNVAFEDGVLPHERVGRHPDELEEERRLAFVGLTRAKEELQLSYAITRDFRGQRRHTIPSSFLMEMPREELELVDAATEFIARQQQAAHGEAWEDDDAGDDSWGDWDADAFAEDENSGATAAGATAGSPSSAPQLPSPCGIEFESVCFESESSDSKPSLRIAAAAITTAAALAKDTPKPALPRVSPDAFRQGQTVLHPEYGPGKIVTLSGTGKNRRATIQFATVGEKKIILAHSAVRPAQ
jgi:DNA helicase-2/ATP-dependent DNA helicase PcrA